MSGGQIHDCRKSRSRARRPHPSASRTSSCTITGAYDPYGLTVAESTANAPCLVPMWCRPYDSLRFTAVFTNLADRDGRIAGAGRQHGVFVMERFCSILAAHELKIDPRGNQAPQSSSPSDAFPRTTTRSSSRIFSRSSLRQRQLRAGARQGACGDWICRLPRARTAKNFAPKAVMSASVSPCYVEGHRQSVPIEGAKVQVQTNGKVNVFKPGSAPRGRGIFTSFAQIVCRPAWRRRHRSRYRHRRHRSVLLGRWNIRHSRGAVVAGNAVNEASRARTAKRPLKLASDRVRIAQRYAATDRLLLYASTSHGSPRTFENTSCTTSSASSRLWVYSYASR